MHFNKESLRPLRAVDIGPAQSVPNLQLGMPDFHTSKIHRTNRNCSPFTLVPPHRSSIAARCGLGIILLSVGCGEVQCNSVMAVLVVFFIIVSAKRKGVVNSFIIIAALLSESEQNRRGTSGEPLIQRVVMTA